MDVDAEHGAEHPVSDWSTGTWHRAGKCGANGCFEARAIGNEVTVRSSRDPDGPSVTYDRDEWKTFVIAVKAGEFDLD